MTTVDTSKAVDRAVHLNGNLPKEGKLRVLEYLISKMDRATLRQLSEEARDKILSDQRLFHISIPGRFQIIGGYQSTVGAVALYGKQFSIVLSDGTLDTSREEQVTFAQNLGLRFGTRAEHQAFTDQLLNKIKGNTMNEAEIRAFQIYSTRYVRDEHGGLTYAFRSFGRRESTEDNDEPASAAFLVSDSLIKMSQ